MSGVLWAHRLIPFHSLKRGFQESAIRWRVDDDAEHIAGSYPNADVRATLTLSTD